MDDPPLARWAWTEAVTAARQRSGPHNPCTKSRLGMELPSSVVAQGAEEGTLHHLNRRTGAAAWILYISGMRKMVDRVCRVCGKQFSVIAYEVARGKGKCCSYKCSAALASINRDQRGSKNNNWKGGCSDNTGRKRRYRKLNPEKHAAHLIMRNAIRRGELVRLPCCVCGEKKSEGHHVDYSKPLDIVWLCKRHHLEAHGGRFMGA